MVNITNQGNGEEYGLNEYVADKREDIKDLKTNIRTGSTCIVIEDASVWILDGSHVWRELA